MLTRPTVEEFEQAADAVRALQGVTDVDVIESDTRFRDRRGSLSVVVEYDQRVPPRVPRELAAHDLGLWSVDRQAGGDAFIVVAI